MNKKQLDKMFDDPAWQNVRQKLNSTHLALARMAFGDKVTKRTFLVYLNKESTQIRMYKGKRPTGEGELFILEAFKYKSDKRAISVKFAYSKEHDRLFVVGDERVML